MANPPKDMRENRWPSIEKEKKDGSPHAFASTFGPQMSNQFLHSLTGDEIPLSAYGLFNPERPQKLITHNS
jgi:hypothetical protein